MSILYSTEAVFVASHSDRVYQDTVQGLYLLASYLINRLQLFNQPSDAQHCIEYLRYLESQPLEAVGVSSDQVKVYLLVVLACQVALGIGDAAQKINEMTDRFRDSLASNIPQPLLERAVSALARGMNSYFLHSPPSGYGEIFIDLLREVNRRLGPHYLKGLVVLANQLDRRFRQMHSIDDYEEAMALLDKIITSDLDKDCPGPDAANALYSSVRLAAERALIYRTPECIEEAIFRSRKFLRIISAADCRRRTVTGVLENLMGVRSGYLGTTREGLQEALPPDPEVTSFPHLVASLRASRTIFNTNWWDVPEQWAKHHLALKTMCRTTDIAEISEAIEYCQLLLALAPPNERIIGFAANGLGNVLFHAFKCTDNIEYLNKAIIAFRNVLGMPNIKWAHNHAMLELFRALADRLDLSADEKDVDELIQLCSMFSKDTSAGVSDRLQISYNWAENARRRRHHTTSTAYETVLSLMEDALLYAPTLEIQHLHLVSHRNVYEELPQDMTSYEVSRGRLPDAIQALERGRALIWSEMRGFRTSIHQIAFASDLAEEFIAVNRELETLTTSVSPDIVTNDDNEDGDRMDKFGRLVVRHRELLTKREELVLQIQALPGLEGFLKKPLFDALRSAAVHGPVIIVNHSKWRCDILVVLHHTHPSRINTPVNFYRRAIELRDRLVNTRKNSPLESRQYQRALRFVLKGLHELVGKSVIQELRRLKIPEQSRIWWCPTSVFCSLPLHAMGPIPSDDGVSRYFSDLYIPSYTPTLSALIESRKACGTEPGKSSFDKPSVRLVANPDDSLQDAWPEIESVQRLDTVTTVTTLLGEGAKASVVLEGLQDHQFSHFICHGNLVPEKPFDASFGLYDGDRLTLLDIVRSRLPNAEFAFLSACHTAELTEGSIADEGLHLTAAVQYCGFRSVVGTMWAMADQDGGDLAKYFYSSMFSSDEPGVPYHERSARALRDAVRTMRKKKRLPLEQWVNFVHYGT